MEKIKTADEKELDVFIEREKEWGLDMDNPAVRNLRQQAKIAKNNASKVFSPNFVPFYPHLLKLGLNYQDIVIFSFVHFFLNQCHNSKFYFSNKQLSEMFYTSENTVSRSIQKLVKLKVFKPYYEILGGGGKIRFIYSGECNFELINQCKNTTTHLKSVSDSPERVSNNNKLKERKDIYIASSFESQQQPDKEQHLSDSKDPIPLKEPPAPLSKNAIPPTLEAVREYAKSIDFSMEAERFIDHYEAVGWLVGRNKMKDWQAAVRTWKRNEKSYQKPQCKVKDSDMFAPRESEINANLREQRKEWDNEIVKREAIRVQN